MADERSFETTVTMAGLTIPVTVEFEITSYGSAPSGYGFDGTADAGDPDEFHITAVVTEFGRDIMATLNEMRDIFWIAPQIELRTAEDDPLTAILAPYRTRLTVQGSTVLSLIEDEIREDADLLTPPDFDDYDPRDYA
jgi:hypothetical protein